jgi:hypothetical protein
VRSGIPVPQHRISTGLSRDAPYTAQARAAKAGPNRMICASPASRLPVLVSANIRQVSHRRAVLVYGRSSGREGGSRDKETESPRQRTYGPGAPGPAAGA